LRLYLHLKKYIYDYLNFGLSIDERNENIVSNKKTIHLNFALLTGFINCFFFIPIYFLLGLVLPAFILIGYLAILCIVQVFLFQKKIQAAKLLSLGSTSFLITSMSLLFGPASYVHLYHFIMLLSPFLIFTNSDKKSLWATSLIVIFNILFTYTFFLFGHFKNILEQSSLQNALSIFLLMGAVLSFFAMIYMMFYSNEQAEDLLKQRNKEINNILNNMQQGIFTIDHQLKIRPGFSSYTATFFKNNSLENLCLRELIQQSNLGPDKIELISTILISSMQEPLFQFALNASLLPSELVFEQQRYMRVFWNPVIDSNQVIEKFMISFIDYTNEVKLKRDSMIKERKLMVISQIINVGRDQLRLFVEDSLRRITTIEKILSPGQFDFMENNQQALIREFHTIKGTGRSFALNEIVDNCFQIEKFLKDHYNQGQIKGKSKDDWENVRLFLIYQVGIIKKIVRSEKPEHFLSWLMSYSPK
jgi:HPt (histidine-containing phosphotransfer) domain-containing protein